MATSLEHLAWLDLGVEEYLRACEIQKRLHTFRRAATIPDTAVLVEHPACITIGRAGRWEHIVASLEDLGAAGIGVHAADRGGDVTYHGPGQLVLYPIVDLQGFGRDVHAYAHRLEQVLIDTLASFGIDAARRKEYPGVWTSRGKIGAIGLRIERWVTRHGISLNVSPDMSHFSLIIPCGITGCEVTSMVEVLGESVEVSAVRAALRESFEGVFEVCLVDVSAEDLGLCM